MARKVRTKPTVESQGLLLQSGIPDGMAIGLDEAGRGCLAGPVVAGAVLFPQDFDLVGLGDSKAISEAERLRLAEEIRHLARGWGIGWAWPTAIAKHNILQASLLAMARALAALKKRAAIPRTATLPGSLLIDGNQLIPPPYFTMYHMPVPEQRAIVGGDALIPAISAASILAKTTRDELMCRMDTRWPHYGFAKHKGYGTKEHREALQTYGPCPMHRMDFRGVLPDTAPQQGTLF